MATPLSLLEALAQVPDPRKKKGVRHPLSAVLSLAVLAMLTGAKSYEAIAQFGRDKGAPLAHALGFRRGKTPCKSCLSELFRALDVVAFEAAVAFWVLSRLPRAEGRTLAIDGKALRGSRDGEAPGQHLVAAYDGDAAAVLGQLRVDCKTNEHKAALALLGILPVRGNVVTGDAAFCQRDLCEEVIGRGGDYVLAVKDNQPSLATDIGAGLASGDQARRLAAACPPLRAGARAAAGYGRPDGGQGPRPEGGALDPHDGGADEGARLEGAEAGLRGDARADGRRGEDGGGGVRDHEPAARAGRRGAADGAGAGALGDRERAALPA